MRQCPECKNYAVDFDFHFQRPRCSDCGWLPAGFKVPHMHEVGIFVPCCHCWGYPELRIGGQCDKCGNKGKVLGPVGKEVVEIVQDIIEKL